MSTAFSNRKMASSAPYRFSAHSRVRSLTCCASLLHFQNGGSAGLSCAQTGRFVSAKTTESKMALKFAHLVSALPHGASRHS